MKSDVHKTLEELEGEDWGESNYDSCVASNCHRLRRVPLKELTVEDLRLMIGQEVGLEYLIPLALDHLEKDVFVEGDLYPGDLLSNTLGTSRDFWRRYPFLLERMYAVVNRAKERIGSRDEDDEINEILINKLNAF